MIYLSILVCANVAFWVADPRSVWTLGFFIILGFFALFILKTHEMHHPFFVDLLWPRFWMLSAPALFLLAQFLVGLGQQPVSDIEVEGAAYLQLADINAWLPVSTAPAEAAVTLAAFCALYIFSICLFLVPKSRHFFERLLPFLCLTAVLVCCAGLLQKALGLDQPFLTRGTGSEDFFAFFPYDGHWAAFAILWCAACFGMALLSTRYEDRPDFVRSTGPWYVAGGVLLGGSGMFVQAAWPASVLLFTAALFLLLLALRFDRLPEDSHHRQIRSLGGLGFVLFLFLAVSRLPFLTGQTNANTNQALRRAAAELFERAPVFGWGIESFQHLLPFVADDRLLGARHTRASSDLLQFLAEFGLVGCAVCFFCIAYLLFRYLRRGADITLTNHLLLGSAAVLLLALVDTPFMSPAVFLSFCILAFSGLRWADLSRNKVDEVDARPSLITHPSERRVPFYTGPEKEVFK